jgi:hypothetical protein
MTNYNDYMGSAVSIDDNENWCENGARIRGLVADMDDDVYIFIEVGESGAWWLESVKVDSKSMIMDKTLIDAHTHPRPRTDETRHWDINIDVQTNREFVETELLMDLNNKRTSITDNLLLNSHRDCSNGDKDLDK